ncbi:hypothetical protein ACJ5H2_13480 [Nocardioides sp. R1-1]|uniref:hypothetical protein n=1 Tax=Nocardioides sp. R1-1 TaxID=3383502 RepID=UPI0038D19039
MTAHIRVLYGNIAGRRRVPRLRNLVKNRRPELVVLTEAYHVRVFLRLLCTLYGYRLKHPGRRHGAEAPDIAVMVRRDGVIVGRWFRKMLRVWWGPFRYPKSKRRPRVYQILQVRFHGVLWPLYLLHWPPGGPSGGVLTRGANAGAWAESMKDFTAWLAAVEAGAGIGDANANRKQLNRLLPRWVRVRMSSGVDAVMSKGLHTSVEHLNSPRGMHGWAIFTLTKK